MSNIIKKAVMQRAHEMKRGPMSLRLRIAWVEIKSAIHSQERMTAIEALRKVTKDLNPMERAIAEMKLLGELARSQGYA